MAMPVIVTMIGLRRNTGQRANRGYLCLPWLPGSAQARVEVPGRALSPTAAVLVVRRGSFMGCVLAGCGGGAWLKKGLVSS